jgi:tetratricopeptide (TPR) repeat protein
VPQADELYRRAQEAHRAGRHLSARRLLDRARGLSDEPDLTGRIELSLAYVESETGAPDEGLARCRAALELEGTSEVTRGLIRSQLALLRMRSGDTAGAFHDFERAVALLAAEPEHLGRALLNRGDLQLRVSNVPGAAADLAAAAHQFRLAGLPEPAAKAVHNLGYARLLAGDLVGALSTMEEAAAVLAPISPVSRAVCEQDRAEVLLAAGRPREAARALRAAADAYGAQRLRRFQAECEYVLAQTLMREDPRQARLIARRSARRFAAHGSPVWAARAEALGIAAEIGSGRGSPSLLRHADGLVDELRSEGLGTEADQLALVSARLAHRRGDLDGARGRLRRVRLSPDAAIPLRLLRQEVRADRAHAQHRPARARREITRGLGELHHWQSSFGSLDLQSTLVGHGRDLATRGLDSALDDGRPALVYEWSERARALVGRVAPVRPPRDPQIAADLATLRQLPAGDPRRTELAEQIVRHSWTAPGGGEVGEPAPLPELLDGLGDAALVAYVVRPGRMAALVATSHDARVVPLGDGTDLRNRLDAVAADLDMAASRTDGPLAAAIRASLERSLSRVAEVLVAPVLPLVGDRRLVLTPSGGLAGTPWTLLPGFVGRPLTIAPSATQWVRNRAPLTDRQRVGLVAGPRVDRADEEVARAAAAWRGAGTTVEVLTGPDASTGHVASLAERVDVLHLAGHGRHSGEHPLFSGVELSDGPWFGHDIDALAATPETVVLSACELGRVSVRSGEEAVGMTAAWLHAGARHVLSSPALVADHMACEALARWHALVAGGRAPAVALAEVGAEVMDGPPLPFLCFGAGW